MIKKNVLQGEGGGGGGGKYLTVRWKFGNFKKYVSPGMFWKASPGYLTQLRCCTLCDARTSCGELRSLFFCCTVNSFPTVYSLLTVNSVTHTLWKTSPHYLTQLRCCTLCDARTSCGELRSLFFLLYRELFSDRELFTDCELREART